VNVLFHFLDESFTVDAGFKHSTLKNLVPMVAFSSQPHSDCDNNRKCLVSFPVAAINRTE